MRYANLLDIELSWRSRVWAEGTVAHIEVKIELFCVNFASLFATHLKNEELILIRH